MLSVYHSLTKYSAPALRRVLKTRLARGKEDQSRIRERMGQPGLPRPAGKLVWFHAASVGEAQSTLVLINALLARYPDIHILVTTGTVTSAALMGQRLPGRAIHQYYPLDHPAWVEAFLNHWNPDLVLWMESELWPNMLHAIRERNIHAVLINARMSRRSYRRWKKARNTAARLLSAFDLCIAQTAEDAESFLKLGTINVRVRDNLKYSAEPLPCDSTHLNQIKTSLEDRPVWLYASTHDGEEQLACALHAALKKDVPGLLTIIVPRHPSRGQNIQTLCSASGLNVRLRTDACLPPEAGDDIYIADTLGELGLFYRITPIACIGRSFSNDGGGGHNPIEAAQLGCVVLHGPNVQNLKQIYEEMDDSLAAICLPTQDHFYQTLKQFFMNPGALEIARKRSTDFAKAKMDSVDILFRDMEPLLVDSGIMKDDRRCA